MANLVKHSTTSNIVRFVLKSSVTGQGLTGLSSASSGLIISTICDNEVTATTYTVAGSTIESITTLGTFAAPTATKCRFKEVDATNHKGVYEFQFADARFSVASAKRLVVSVTGATNLLDTDYEIQLVQFDPYDSVRLGLTALPNAAADAAGGLPISDAGGLDLDDQKADINTLLSQVANIAAVGTAVNTVAESYTLTTGTQTSGTYTSTALLDGVPHTHTDTAGTLDLYYQFDIGVQGLPSAVGLTAYSNGASDDFTIQAYNWGGATWETVGTLVGKSGATYDSYTFTLLTRHAGTGANIGKVRIRFYSATLTSATLRIDQLFISYSMSQSYQYTAGTVNDAAGTTTSFKTTLTQVDNFWNDALLVFTSGSLAGQAKPILDFANTNGVITLDEALTSAPANGDAFVIKAEHIHPVSQIVDGVWDEPLTGATHNVATSSGRRLRSMGDVVSSTVNDASATTTSFVTALTSAVNNFYVDQTMYFDSGALAGSSRAITSYNGTTKAVTFDEAWTSAPANGDSFSIDPVHIHNITQIQSGLATAASIAALNNLSAAQVNAEVLDVLQTDTFAELAAIPGATSSLKDKLTFIFMLARNQLEQTSTTATLRRDDTTTAVGTASVSDNGTTATRGEWA